MLGLIRWPFAVPPPHWFAALGGLSAFAIWAGLLVPLGIPSANTLNFIGYVAWSGWMLCLAALAPSLLQPVEGPG